MKNDLQELAAFMFENAQVGQMNTGIASQIEALWNEYKLNTLLHDFPISIIDADFGVLGSLIIRDVKSVDPCKQDLVLEYKPGNYDFVSITESRDRRILWTDFSDVEPYNRQSGLYCGGMSWEILGAPVRVTDTYREFQHDHRGEWNIAFAVWGFDYNDYYGSVRFGIVIPTNKVDEFISRIREIIGK